MVHILWTDNYVKVNNKVERSTRKDISYDAQQYDMDWDIENDGWYE